ncbi:MAG: response regulator transcription factor [Silvibacterium sp.]
MGPGPLRVLLCVGTNTLSNYLTVLRAEVEIDLLPITLPADLPFRVRSDQPDAIVIVTEEFPATTWRNSSSLRKALSATPSLLLVREVNDSLKQRAARFHIQTALPLDVTTDQLLAAIWATVAGLAVTLELSSQEEDEHTGWIATDERLVERPLTEHLTARETVVLRLMALGHSNKEIASRLDISEHTAKFHVSSVLAKLGAASRTEAVTIGIMCGLVAI